MRLVPVLRLLSVFPLFLVFLARGCAVLRSPQDGQWGAPVAGSRSVSKYGGGGASPFLTRRRLRADNFQSAAAVR